MHLHAKKPPQVAVSCLTCESVFQNERDFFSNAEASHSENALLEKVH